MDKAARSHKAATGLGCDGCHSKVLLDLPEEPREEIDKFPGKSGTVWEMTATRLHDDVQLNSKDRHERAAHCSPIVGKKKKKNGKGEKKRKGKKEEKMERKKR